MLPIMILVAGLGFFAVGVGVAVKATVRARREWGELDDAFSDAGGHALDPESAPAPWSSFDLAVLRDDVAAVDHRDPFATLTRASAPISWHQSSSNGAEPRPIVWRAPVEAAAAS